MSTQLRKKSSGTTMTEMLHCSYTWTIENFRFMSKTRNWKLNSTVFEMGDNGEFKWMMHLYPFGLVQHRDREVSLFLQLISPEDANNMVNFEFFVATSQGGRQRLSKYQIRNFKQWTSLGYRHLINRRLLVSEKSNYLIDGHLTIECEVHLATGKVFNRTAADELEQVKMERKLLNDIEKLLAKGIMCDVTLVAGRGRFPAHKVILASRSPVFEAMFNHDMMEAQQNEVQIADLDERVLEHLLRFIYTGTVKDEIEEGLAKGLFAAADKYALDDLKEVSEKRILACVTVENAIDTLMIAHQYNSASLKDAVIKFMKSNAPRIVDSFSALVLNCEEESEEERGDERRLASSGRD